MNKAHEEAHRSGYETAFAKCKARFEKELIGKDDSDLDKAAQEICRPN
jgi:hypothetical protein